MRLSELLSAAGVSVDAVPGSARDRDVSGVPVTGIALDSTKVAPGFVFAALPGRNAHGAEFARTAADAGAVAVVTDARGAAEIAERGGLTIPIMVALSPRKAVAQLSAAFWGSPSDSMSIVGVTGTNGKTTVTHLVQAGIRASDESCGVIGTLGAILPGRLAVPQSRTTPEAPELQETLARMRDAGARVVAMEVSSIALRECRVDGITFEVAAFTGLSQDHLDYHGTMQEYFEAKAELFVPARTRHAVVSIDDSWGRLLMDRSTVPITTVSSRDPSADWFISVAAGRFSVSGPEEFAFDLPVATDFMAMNVTISVAICHLLGVPTQLSADAAVAERVPGRMEVVATCEGVDFVVDYAHTPDAIRRVVSTAVDSTRPGGGRVIVVLGAGGDRDPSKREDMGRAASIADVVFVTDDNPRSEDPSVIRAGILAGIAQLGSRASEVVPRSDAIRQAVQIAQSGDVVLVLGKGHERTQEIAGEVHPFDDRVVLASFVRDRFGTGEEGGRR